MMETLKPYHMQKNFLHSQAVGIKNFECHCSPRATWWNFHYLILFLGNKYSSDRLTVETNKLFLKLFSFFDKITNLISNSMHEIDNLCNDSFVVEVVQHLDMCKKRYVHSGKKQRLRAHLH